MTDKEKELIVYCLKANSYFHGEVCEECKNYPKCDHFQYDSLMEKLIKTLEQEPCEDAVSRQAVKEQMIKYGFHAPDMTVTEFIEDCLSPVNSQKIGHWIRVDDTKMRCSNCDIIHLIAQYPRVGINYCPNCGAKMVEPKESED